MRCDLSDSPSTLFVAISVRSSATRWPPSLAARTGARPSHTHRVRYELSQYEYIQTVLELVEFLRMHGAAASSVLVIDQVNPLPFAMGARAPRGGNLWWAEEIPWRPPEEAFGDTDYVAIPRFPTRSIVVEHASTCYQEYFATEFAPSFETRYWAVLKRRSTPPTSSD